MNTQNDVPSTNGRTSGFRGFLSIPTAFLLATALLTGCKSTGYVKSDTTASYLQATAVEIRMEIANLDCALKVLNDFTNTPSGDLSVHFQQFSRALDQLAASSKRTADRVAGLKRRNTAYFETWDQELAVMSDAQIHEVSAARKAEVIGQNDAALRSYQDSQTALVPLIAYFQDIGRALSTDLTIAGLQAVRQPLENANRRASVLQAQLDQIANNLNALAVNMSSYVLPPTK